MNTEGSQAFRGVGQAWLPGARAGGESHSPPENSRPQGLDQVGRKSDLVTGAAMIHVNPRTLMGQQNPTQDISPNLGYHVVNLLLWVLLLPAIWQGTGLVRGGAPEDISRWVHVCPGS